MSTAGKILNGIWYLGIIALVLASSNAALTQTPSILSYVTSKSMEPTLHVNDYYFIVPKSITDFKLGDIVVFRSENQGYFVHRIIEDTQSGFITKGDNSPVTDQQSGEPVVTENKIIGKVLTYRGTPLVLPGLWKVTRHFSVLYSLIRKNLTWVGTFFLGVAGISWYVERNKPSKKRGRRKPLRIKNITLPALILMLVISSLFMLLAQEKISFDYWTSYLREGARYQRPNTEFEMMVEIYNLGPVPHFIFVDAPTSLSDTKQFTQMMGPNSMVEIPLIYHAQSHLGHNHEQIEVFRFLPLLPAPILESLLIINVYLPILVIDMILFVPIYFLYRWINPDEIILPRSNQTGGVI